MVIELLAGTMRLDRISPEAVGRAARFACRVAIRLPDEQREEPCAARSQEVERALCGVRNCRGGGRRMRRTSQKWYDTHQHHFSETPVFVGCGVRAVGTNEYVSTS